MGRKAPSRVRIPPSPLPAPALGRRLHSCIAAPVAQLDRASVYGTEGQRFESSRARWFTRTSGARARDLAPGRVRRGLVARFQRHDLHDTHARLRRVTHRTRAESAWLTWYPANCVQRVLALVGVRGVYPAGGEG